MKLLVLCVFVAVAGMVAHALAAPKIAQNAEDVQLLLYESDNDGLGTYHFAYEQSDGSARNEEGELKNAGTDDEFVAVQGSYSWISPDGVKYIVTYIADENGYKASVGPGPVGTPPAVVASLLG